MMADDTQVELYEDRQRATVWIGFGVLWLLLLAVFVWFAAQLGAAALSHPVSLMLYAGFLGIAVLCLWAGLRRRVAPVSRRVMRADAEGIEIAEGPVIPWSQIEAIVYQSMYVGWGISDRLHVRLRFTPNGTAARRAERTVQHILNQPGFAIQDTGLSWKQVLDKLHGPLAGAGLQMADRPSWHFRGLYTLYVFNLGPKA